MHVTPGIHLDDPNSMHLITDLRIISAA